MKILNDQKGFGLIEGVLIVIALTLIAFVGFYVYNANKQEPKVSDSSIYQKTENKPATEEQTDYLTIKELGIKADKSAVPGAYYEINKDDSYSDFPEITTVSLYDKAYDNTENADGAKCSDFLAPIVWLSVIEESVRDAKYSKYKNEKSIGLDVPPVLSDKYNTKGDGLLYSYVYADGVQAPPSCVGDDYAIEKPANKKVMDQLKESRSGLAKLSESFVKE